MSFITQILQLMKQIKLLLFATLFLFLAASCSSNDDDRNDNVNNSIVGTWKFDKSTDFTLVIKSNNETFNSVLKEYVIADRIFGEQSFTFNANGSYSSVMRFAEDREEETGNGTYTHKDNILTLIEEDDDESPESASAMVKDNVLTLITDKLAEFKSEAFLSDIYYECSEKLKDVDKNTLEIQQAAYIFKYKRK